MKRLGYLAVFTLFLGLAQVPPSFASDEGSKQEVSLQGTGFFTKDSQGRGISQHATDTGGFLLGFFYGGLQGRT